MGGFCTKPYQQGIHFRSSPPPPLIVSRDWPGLCLFCCYQSSCVISQQRWFFAFFLFHKLFNLPPTPRHIQRASPGDSYGVSVQLHEEGPWTGHGPLSPGCCQNYCSGSCEGFSQIAFLIGLKWNRNYFFWIYTILRYESQSSFNPY